MSQKNIPGPQGMPILGSLLPFRRDTLGYLSQLVEEYGNVVRFTALGTRFVLVADPNAIHEILVKQVENFPKDDFDIAILSKYIGHGLLTTTGEIHRQQRRLSQPAFHARRIQSYADTMVDYTEKMLDEWRPDTVRDVSRDMVDLTMYIVSKTVFDTDREEMMGEASAIGRAIHQMQALADQDYDDLVPLPAWLPLPRRARYRESRTVLNGAMERILAERASTTEHPDVVDRGDLLSMLLMTQDDEGQGMSHQEIHDQLKTLFIAGHETTSNALSWTWYLLSQHPHVEAQLHEELDRVLAGRTPTLGDLRNLPYTRKVIKESMRMYPPAWSLNLRQVKETTTVSTTLSTAEGDVQMDAGDIIMISPYIVHRNPRLYPEPTRFDPERFSEEQEAARHRYAYLPFGGGPRVCIGNAFASMEAELILATIAQRFRLGYVGPLPVEPQAQVTMSPKGGLPMRLHPRTPNAETNDEPDNTLAEPAPTPVLA